MTPRQFDAFVFDLDGTLVDTASELVAAYQRLCVEYGTGEQPYETVRKLISHGSGRLVTEATGIDQSDSRWETYRQQYLDWYEEILGTSAVPYPGTVDMVAEIADAGLTWGIVTNKPTALTLPLLDQLKLSKRCQVVVCGDTLAVAKPDPEPVHFACRQLGSDPASACFVGDHIRDIDAGNAAGATTITALYGYIPKNLDAKKWPSHATIEKPLDLIRWLELVS